MRGTMRTTRRLNSHSELEPENYVPQRNMEDVKYEFGFLSRTCLRSLLHWETLRQDFIEQSLLQDQWNIEMARNKGKIPSPRVCRRLQEYVMKVSVCESAQSATPRIIPPQSVQRTNSDQTNSIDCFNSEVDTLEYPLDNISTSSYDSSHRRTQSGVDEYRPSVDDHINNLLYTPTPIDNVPSVKLTRTTHKVDADSDSSDDANMDDALVDKIVLGSPNKHVYPINVDNSPESISAPSMSPCTPPMSHYSPQAPDMSPLDDLYSDDEAPVLSPKIFPPEIFTSSVSTPANVSSSNKWASHHRNTSYRPPPQPRDDLGPAWGRTPDTLHDARSLVGHSQNMNDSRPRIPDQFDSRYDNGNSSKRARYNHYADGHRI